MASVVEMLMALKGTYFFERNHGVHYVLIGTVNRIFMGLDIEPLNRLVLLRPTELVDCEG